MNARVRLLFRYIVPAMGGLFVTYLYNVVDGIFIGRRVKRKALYLRNGFHETGHYTFFPDGQRCEVICSKGRLDEESFRNFVHEFHKHWENFPDKLA